MDSPFGTFDIEKLYCKHYIHNILAAQIIENCEKEDKEMITAEEARKITCKNHKIISSLIDDMINKDIKTAAEDGKFVTVIEFNKNSILRKYLSNVVEILMDNKYDVTVEDLNTFDDHDHRLRISWARR